MPANFLFASCYGNEFTPSHLCALSATMVEHFTVRRSAPSRLALPSPKMEKGASGDPFQRLPRESVLKFYRDSLLRQYLLERCACVI